MKKRLLIFTICILLLLLAGCAQDAQPPTATEAASAAKTAEPSVLRLQPFSDADTAAMSRFMCRNRWLIDGKSMYGLDYDEGHRPVLASYTLKNGRPSKFQILSDNCVPEYLAIEGERLYFLHEGQPQVYDLKSRARQALAEGPWYSLQIYEGALYYTDAEHRYCRAALDGSGEELLIDAPCDYAWSMPEGIVYQSEGEAFCLCWQLWDGAQRQLTAAASYAPLRLGATLWYSQHDREGQVLATVDLTDGTVRRQAAPAISGEAELIVQGGAWLLRYFPAERSWAQRLLVPGESEGVDCGYSGYRLCDYLDEARRIDAAYEADGRLRCFVLVNAAGEELRFIGGQILG